MLGLGDEVGEAIGLYYSVDGMCSRSTFFPLGARLEHVLGEKAQSDGYKRGGVAEGGWSER